MGHQQTEKPAQHLFVILVAKLLELALVHGPVRPKTCNPAAVWSGFHDSKRLMLPMRLTVPTRCLQFGRFATGSDGLQISDFPCMGCQFKAVWRLPTHYMHKYAFNTVGNDINSRNGHQHSMWPCLS